MSSLFETLSLTCRRIILEDLQVDMEIGAHAEEHGDNLDEVYSYSVLPQIVTETISEGHIRLQETFGDRLLERILADKRVSAARVKTAKLHACIGAKAVAVETFRHRI